MARTSAYKTRVQTGSEDSNALILLADGALVGVLVELADECHGLDRGKWVIEATFGVHGARVPDNFGSANDAATWLSAHFATDSFNLERNVSKLI
jgi:hypothetical protein